MNLVDYNVLSNICNELRRELSGLNEMIECNECCIKESDKYIQSLIGSEPIDFKFFSPRNVESKHKEEIEKTFCEKKSYEEKNDVLFSKKKVLCERISQLEDVLQHRNHNLTVLKIQEEDRQRIARELHDTSLQNLTHLIHRLELSGLYIDKDSTKAKLELSVISKILRDTIEEIRGTIFNLRPMTFDDLGLKIALERMVSEFNQEKKYFIKLDIDDVSCENEIVLVSIYRIVQECLNNIKKHANAENISVFCKICDDDCLLEIKDDGNGFDVEDSMKIKHFSLALMTERIKLLNGEIKIISEAGKGTSVNIKIPLSIYNNCS